MFLNCEDNNRIVQWQPDIIKLVKVLVIHGAVAC